MAENKKMEAVRTPIDHNGNPTGPSERITLQPSSKEEMFSGKPDNKEVYGIGPNGEKLFRKELQPLRHKPEEPLKSPQKGIDVKPTDPEKAKKKRTIFDVARGEE